MTPKQLKDHRTTLTFTQERLAEELGVTRITVNRWENGAQPIPETAAKLVECILASRRLA